jgi:hypothetical protein
MKSLGVAFGSKAMLGSMLRLYYLSAQMPDLALASFTDFPAVLRNMARMAEALVNLTSIKRRVSRGFETADGPLEVAVISKSDGLVWAKRKHYLPSELNPRDFDHIRSQDG